MVNKVIFNKFISTICAVTILSSAIVPCTVSALDTSEKASEVITTEDNSRTLLSNSSNMPNINSIENVLISSIHSTSIVVGVGDYIRLVPDIGSGKNIVWSSSNSNTANIVSEEYGVIYSAAKGSATIRCKNSNGKTAICNITVMEAPTSISINKENLTLGENETFDFKGTLSPKNSAGNISYCSSNSLNLPVNSKTGHTVANKEGKYTVACVTYNNYKEKCSVIVKKEPSSLSLSKSTIDITENDTEVITPVFPNGSYSNTLDVSSSDSSIAEVSVDENQKIKINAKKEGTAKITAKIYNGKTAVCNIKVSKEIPVKLNISATSTSILKGNHVYVGANVTPSDTPVTYSSSNTNVATVSKNGIVTGVGAGNAEITVKAGNITKTCTINVSPYSSDTYLPYSTYTLNNAKTLYLKSIGSSFSSSDTTVATVDSNGFVTAKKQGVAIITANYQGSKRTCAITVIGSEPVRFSYSSPNSASKNERVTLIAITDTARTSVKFDVKDGNTTKTVTATSKELNSTGNRYIWKGYYTFKNAGEYSVTAYSMYKNNGKYSTCPSGKSTAFVTDVTSASTVSYSKRRPSDGILAMNAQYEGFLSKVSDDPLVYDAPTVGHGYVVTNGETFYNNISREEAFAFMVSTMNDSYYSSSVNNYLASYNMKFNQQQFDALVMMSYNLGSGVLYDSDVTSILTNSWYNGERNLNYVNKKSLQNELVQWHHAGGSCVWGLLYRRIDELEVFCYNDYVIDGSSNKYGMTYRWYCYG